MSDELFAVADLYAGDPLRPDLVTVTPPEIVASLTRPQREQRVRHLVAQAHEIYLTALREHLRGRELVAQCVLFSGGNDSTTLAHLFRYTATHAVHANTTIGAEETRQYVRDACKAWGLPLIEEKPPHTFEELVLGDVYTRKGEQVWEPGFPGPGAHAFVYGRLKERALDKVRHVLGVANSRTKAVTFIAGRRRQESDRRADIPLFESDGTVIWVSPLAMWTKLDLNTYRLMCARSDDPVPVNWVADLMHMSMECLCGAYAHPGELDEIRQHFPHIAAEIEALQDKARARGIPEPYCTWGHGQGKPATKSGRLCSSCDDRFQALLPEDGAA